MVMHYLYYTVNLDLLLAHAAIISPLPANVRDDKFHVTPVPLGLVKGRLSRKKARSKSNGHRTRMGMTPGSFLFLGVIPQVHVPVCSI